MLPRSRLVCPYPGHRPVRRIPPRDQRARGTPKVADLLAALSRHRISHITSEEKKAGRDLVMRGGPWTDSERREILDYCETDVVCLPQLLEAMLPGIAPTPQALGQALLRGRYMAAVARMERAGVPIDAETLTAIRDDWEHIKDDSDQRRGCRLRRV